MPRLVESLRRVAKGRSRMEPAFAKTKTKTKTFTLPEQIAENVAEAVIGGNYPPGSWIAEQDLADQFGVSRGPIREALRILEKEGLIRILPRRGTLVIKLTRHEVLNIFSIRAVLMALAGRQTAEQLTPEVEKELAESVPVLERLTHGRDVNEFLRAAYRVSMLLARTSNNDRLHELILSMARQTLALTRMALDKRDNRRIWTNNWRAVVESIVAKDPSAAERAAHRLVTETGLRAAEHAADDLHAGQGRSRANSRNSRGSAS